VALVGDCDPSVAAHRAIPLALARARSRLGRDAEWLWVGTETIGAAGMLARFDAFWCVPASPYRSAAGALAFLAAAVDGRHRAPAQAGRAS
jgi:hypothetical protein